jgi:hypothetical protein
MTNDAFVTAYIDFLKTALALAVKARKESILELTADVVNVNILFAILSILKVKLLTGNTRKIDSDFKRGVAQ